MFKIDTASPRWRQLAVTSLALPLSLALSGTATAANAESAADLALSVSCFGIDVTSDKDISNVKVTFADGTFEELSLTGLVFSRSFTTEIASVTAKSGTTEVSGVATGCSTAPAGDEDQTEPVETEPEKTEPEKTEPVKDQELPDPANGTATVTITVDCRTVSVTSDKDISNVKVTFADGTEQEINGLSGVTFERTFDKDIDFATSKSATTEVLGDAEACAAPAAPAPVVVDEKSDVVVETPAPVVVETPTPVVVETPIPVCPTEQVMGPVMAGCDTPAVPIDGRPAPEPANGGGEGVVTPPPAVEETPAPVEQTPAPVEQTPVVAEETPDQSTVGTPIAGRPAPQPAVGGTTAAPAAAPAPVAGTPAQAPVEVVANSAVAPAAVTVAPAALTPAAVSTVAAPAALPFTGTDTDALLTLGSVLVMAGGGAMLVGRRARTGRHARTAKHARLA